jgi:pyruvate dehydrogenase E1 component alpha subunit
MATRKNKSTATKKRKAVKSKADSRPVRKKTAPKAPKKTQPETTPMAVLNSQKLKDLYALMMKSHILAERTSVSGRKRTVSGFEATLVGAGAHVQSQDCVMIEHSGSVVSLIKGTPLTAILTRTQSEESSFKGDDGPSMNHAIKMVRKMKGKGLVMLMFCPHDSQTLFFERKAMAIAATEKLPLVCLVEKSFNSEIVEPQNAALGKNSAFYPAIAVDGGDVVAVFRVTQEAIRRAREGHGPALIECFTARANRAPQKTSESSLAQDPLTFMEQYLRKRKLWSNQRSQKMIAAFTRELEDAFKFSEAQRAETPFDNVYSGNVKSSLQPTKVSSSQEKVSVLQ